MQEITLVGLQLLLYNIIAAETGNLDLTKKDLMRLAKSLKPYESDESEKEEHDSEAGSEEEGDDATDNGILLPNTLAFLRELLKAALNKEYYLDKTRLINIIEDNL